MRLLKLIFFVIAALMFFIAGCGKKQEEQPASAETRSIFHVFSYDGPMGARYMVHFDSAGKEATLFTHDETLILKHEATASGAKFQGDRIMVWIKGDEVLMEVDGKRVGPCSVSGLQNILSRAWLSGGDFWAVGNEPSWNLVMGKDRVILLTEMGQKSMEFKGLEMDIFNAREPYGIFTFTNEEKHELEVEILTGRCTDIMSGEPFAVSVKIRFDGKEMLGCGTGLF